MSKHLQNSGLLLRPVEVHYVSLCPCWYAIKEFGQSQTVNRRLKYLLSLTLTILLLTQPSPPANAHPLDEFYQVTFISVGSEQISLTVELYTGVLVAPQVIELIDTDADELFSAAEQQAYAQRFIDDISLNMDAVAVPVAIERVEFPPLLELQAGVGVIRMFLAGDISGAAPGPHQIFYENNHFPDRGVYIVSAVSADAQAAEIARQEPDVFQKSVNLAVTLHDAGSPVESSGPVIEEPAPPPAPEPVELPTGAPTEGQRWLTGYLYQAELPMWLMGVVLLASIALGGLHALTPGHGKTLVAAYLIGSRGTMQHAMFLGGIVTFTHTASVIVIGLLALLASRYIVPDILVPALEVVSGLLVVAIGVQLIWARWREYRGGSVLPEHTHHHHHHSHNHDDSHHHHKIPDRVTLRDLLALGISGGLVPCPEALGIMLIAIGLNRILLGLGMVVAFSFGLAAVLIVIGILLVRAKNFLESAGRAGQRWQNLLPLISAIIVTVLGVGIMLKGLWPYMMG